MASLARGKEARARRWLRPASQVGESPALVGRPSVFCDEGSLRIGDRFTLASLPVPSHLVAGPGATLEIGNEVSIGHGAAIAAYENVRIGDNTRIGPFVIIMDTNFHGGAGDQSIQHDCRPVVIGRACTIGSRVTITRGVVIGDRAEVLSGSVVTSTIPPGACVAGGPARVIGSAGDLAARWDSPAAALPEILMVALNLRAPPDLDGRLLGQDAWTATAREALTAQLAARLGMRVDPEKLRALHTFEDLAHAVLGTTSPPDFEV